MTSGFVRGARRQNNGSEMHSQTSQVCPGIQENWLTGNRRKCISKFPIQRYGETPGSSECLGALSRRTATCRERFERLINRNATDVTPVIPSTVEESSPAGDAVSTRRHIEARSPSCWSEEVEMEMMPVHEDAMEVQPEFEMGTESVRSGTKRASSTWEDCADKINMEACLNTVGECRRCDADEVLATVAGVRSEPTQLQECEVFKWCGRYKRSSMQTVISTRMPHEAKRNRAQPRIVIPEYANAMRVSEHYESTPCTRTQKLMINSMMSRCRTRQPESYDTLSAFLHDWLERGVWTEPPSDPRLNGGWCWQLVRALLLLSPGASVRWS